MTHHETMLAAFNVVDPTRPAFPGYPAQDWRDPIRTSGTRGAIETAAAHFGVTFDDVIESIGYMTATEARVSEPNERGVITIEADGYRAGPAGDH